MCQSGNRTSSVVCLITDDQEIDRLQCQYLDYPTDDAQIMGVLECTDV